MRRLDNLTVIREVSMNSPDSGTTLTRFKAYGRKNFIPGINYTGSINCGSPVVEKRAQVPSPTEQIRAGTVCAFSPKRTSSHYESSGDKPGDLSASALIESDAESLFRIRG